LKHGKLALTVENNKVVTLEWHELDGHEEAPGEVTAQ
jgi:hypothetical protein